MGFYERHVGPRLVRCACAMANVSAEREKIVPRAAGTVLEVGFGPGLNLPFYDPARVSRVIGVDPNEAFLKLGAARRRAAKIPVEIRTAPAESLPLEDACVDTAVITYTLCSVHDPMRSLSEVRRVLRPGGRALFLEHGLSRDPKVARWQSRLNPLWRAVAVGCNLIRPVAASFRAAGFALTELEEYYLPGTPKPLSYFSRGVAHAVQGGPASGGGP
ncbi:Methyltransferase type 11 [Methylobacterium sp. 4-46]|uniref:class I SAM-dependent methyltransferase n=1 Tax=unclassified Methylobacterium TaxID=2615210 RepID=UPI000152D7BE|nr:MULTISPECIES: class I SAM-dependent methyltransferase [Methylobacterium]ACA15121.1 Methyltransferase type 11 [Methylobacterium sp. 4-46]WFT80854.1 class I SAM-dependent methyltransferase [Methylobacterium nodulans]